MNERILKERLSTFLLLFCPIFSQTKMKTEQFIAPLFYTAY